MLIQVKRHLTLTTLLILFGHCLFSQNAPGDQDTGLTLWLKADAGVEEAAANPAEDGDPVLNWLDQSGGAVTGVSSDTDAPTYETSGPNGNPMVIFVGDGSGGASDDHLQASILASDLFSAADNLIFVVHRLNTSLAAILSFWQSGAGNRYLTGYTAAGLTALQFPADTEQALGATDINGAYYITVFESESTGTDSNNIYHNGGSADGSFNFSGTLNTGLTRNFSIGATAGANFGMDVDLAEFIVYSVSSTDRRDVESYLAIKYGITLDISSTGYTLGATTLYAVDATFDNDIAGIGQDDSQELDQTTSQSINSTSVLSVSAATSQEDGDFLIWGHNGGTSTALTGDYIGSTNNGSARIWKVEETGDVGSITLTVAQADLPGGVAFLYVKNGDAALGTGGTGTPLTDVGGVDWQVTVDLSDGDYFSFVNDTPLPIELFSFSSRTQDNGVELLWSTASEINNDFFTLERSIDGNEWRQLDRINGSGNSSKVTNYAYVDQNPFIGTSFYRLSQTDYDGTSESFEPIAVYYDRFEEKIKILGNPSRLMELESSLGQGYELSVLSLSGQVVLKKKLPNGRSSFEIKVRNQVVILKVSDASGRLVFSERILLQ